MCVNGVATLFQMARKHDWLSKTLEFILVVTIGIIVVQDRCQTICPHVEVPPERGLAAVEIMLQYFPWNVIGARPDHPLLDDVQPSQPPHDFFHEIHLLGQSVVAPPPCVQHVVVSLPVILERVRPHGMVAGDSHVRNASVDLGGFFHKRHHNLFCPVWFWRWADHFHWDSFRSP